LILRVKNIIGSVTFFANKK